MRTILISLLLAANVHAQCGSESIQQKDLSFSDTAFLSRAPVAATVKSLGLLPRTTAPFLVTVTGTIYRYKLEADGDIHAAIRSGEATMIVEFPNPACPEVQRSSRYAQMKETRAWFVRTVGVPAKRMKFANVTATFTGAFFIDKPHGQFGMAPNAGEIHPCLSIQ